MSKNTDSPLIDFRELASKVRGEKFEWLIRSLAKNLGLSPVWSGRGPDQGKDLILTEYLQGAVSRVKITWLVSCKDFTGTSVSEKNLPQPGIKDKLEQHNADGFLLATTTTVSTGAKALLDGLDNSSRGFPHIQIWDQTELTTLLLNPKHHEVLKQFLPESYRRVKGLTTIEGALLEFRDQLPDTVINQIRNLIRPYSEVSLKGSTVWPYDSEMASIIDDVFVNLLVQKNVDEAAQITEGLNLEAFMALAESLLERFPNECFDYLYNVVTRHHSSDFRLNAFQLLAENYELSPEDNIELACCLDSSDTLEIFGDEIQYYIQSELVMNTPAYDCYSDLDQLSSHTEVESVMVESLIFDPDPPYRIAFKGDLRFEVNFNFAREPMGGTSLPGEFSGYFDRNGMFLEEVTVDIESFYGDSR